MNKRGNPAGIDENNPEWTKKDFARARPASEVLPRSAAAALTRKRGRPPKGQGERKEQVTLRLSPHVLNQLRATGEGWQTRVDEYLRSAEVMDAAIEAAGGLEAITEAIERQRRAIGAFGGFDKLAEIQQTMMRTQDAFRKQAEAVQSLLGKR